jgi:hypothetical protein
MTCTCEAAGLCPTYGKHQSRWQLQICRGEVLTPELCEAYRRNWLALKTDAAGPRPPCRLLGPETRRQECPSCSGKVLLKIFACQQHGEATPDTQIAGIACCRGCRDYQPPNDSSSPE